MSYKSVSSKELAFASNKSNKPIATEDHSKNSVNNESLNKESFNTENPKKEHQKENQSDALYELNNETMGNTVLATQIDLSALIDPDKDQATMEQPNATVLPSNYIPLSDELKRPYISEPSPSSLEDLAPSPKDPTLSSPKDKLSQLYGSDEDDETLFARLKYERALYKELGACADIHSLETSVATTLNKVGFSEYSYIRLDAINNTDALMPIGLLSSYYDKAFGSSGLLLRAQPNSVYNRHLSTLYHFVASIAPVHQATLNTRQYVLIVGDGYNGYYLSVTSLTGPCSHYFMSTSPLQKQEDAKAFLQLVQNHQGVLDHLSIIIREIGCDHFPDYFGYACGINTFKINPRPLRLLNTLAKKDVSLREAAELLFVSPDTINKHVAAAKAALGTTTIATAIWKALQEGVLDCDCL